MKFKCVVKFTMVELSWHYYHGAVRNDRPLDETAGLSGAFDNADMTHVAWRVMGGPQERRRHCGITKPHHTSARNASP